MRWIAALCIGIAMAGCSPAPGDQDIRQIVSEHMPSGSVSVDRLETTTTSAGDGVLVKFKATLKTTEALMSSVGFSDAAAAVGADANMGVRLEEALQSLSVDGQAKFKLDVDQLAAKPEFLSVTQQAGSASEWYGSFNARKVVDKWVASDFKTEVEPKLTGKPRKAFSANALEIGGAKEWFADRQAKQQALLQRLEDAVALEKKDAELVRQQGVTQQERQAKEALLNSLQQAARRLPLQVAFRKATLNGSGVLQIRAQQAMTINLEVQRGFQRFAREIQLVGGKVLEVGHLEGWAFQTGDRVTLSNSAFDSASFVVPEIDASTGGMKRNLKNRQ